MFKKFYLKNKLILMLLLFPIIVIAATWGPISIPLLGGVNRDLDFASDQSAGWPAATAAMKAVLGSKMVGLNPPVKAGDKVKFIYSDGTHVLKWGGGPFLTTMPFIEVSASSSSTGCGAGGTITNSTIDGHWEMVSGTACGGGGCSTTYLDKWVIDSISQTYFPKNMCV